MSETSNKFCMKCGAALPETSAFCPGCGTPRGQVAGAQPPAYVPYQRREKGEKPEKQEKHEKGEKREKQARGERWGAILGGIVVLWLGVSLFLGQYYAIPGENWSGYFLMGLGVILMGTGLIRWSRGAYRYPPMGFLIGGAVVFMIGISSALRFENYSWLILVMIGVIIIVAGIAATRARAPPPK